MHDHDIILGRFARGLIRRKARLLTTFPEFQDQLVEDLEQELFLRLTSGMDLFDPVLRHPNVFVTTVVERAVAQMLRKRRAAKSGTGRVFPFSALGNDNQSGFEPLDVKHQVWRAELRLDLQTAITKLSPALRELADRLQRQSVAEISDDLNLAQSTVWRRVAQLRKQFENAGLRIYL